MLLVALSLSDSMGLYSMPITVFNTHLQKHIGVVTNFVYSSFPFPSVSLAVFFSIDLKLVVQICKGLFFGSNFTGGPLFVLGQPASI